MLRTEKGRKKGTESTQRDKALDGSRGEARGNYNNNNNNPLLNLGLNIFLQSCDNREALTLFQRLTFLIHQFNALFLYTSQLCQGGGGPIVILA